MPYEVYNISKRKIYNERTKDGRGKWKSYYKGKNLNKYLTKEYIIYYTYIHVHIHIYIYIIHVLIYDMYT